MSTGRLEAFSDGVIAVAITLLVLNIGVPSFAETRQRRSPTSCGVNWPVYAAYVTSFLTIGIIWINHHVMIRRLREPDHMILFLNLLLLMSIAVLPFATEPDGRVPQAEPWASTSPRRSTAERSW